MTLPTTVKAPPTCRLCPAPATVTLAVKPFQGRSPRRWSLGDPLCDTHADHVAKIMRIPVRREAIT